MSRTNSKFKGAGVRFCFAMAVGAAAAACSKPPGAGDYLAAKDRIISAFKAETGKCAQLSGNASNVCMQRAVGDRSIALAELAFQYSGKPEDRARVALAKRDATYELAKQMCDEQMGSVKEACIREADAARKTDTDAHQVSSTDARAAAGNG
jgi:hypothetical protein